MTFSDISPFVLACINILMYYKLGSIWYQNNFMSPLKLPSVLHYEFKFWRYEASKMVYDFLDTLYYRL